ncbi:MAG: hypothetical protein J6M25_06710 [Prevotella sp.]|nr:hypothetical protein [Prevotella sp.]
MMMQSLLRNLLSAVLFACATVTAVAVLHGCSRTESYPQALVEADSACVAGYYGRADSLLAGSEAQTADLAEPVRMYRQLVVLTRKYVGGGLSVDDFSMADSLCRYYHEAGPAQKEARALLLLGSTYALVDDNPSALSCCLKAESLARRHADLLTESWACQDIGDIYFNQRMLLECKSYFRRYADISSQFGNTMKMAYALSRMALVYTIEDNIDSIIYCYQRSNALASEWPQGKEVVCTNNFNLCDIYIQTEQYDKAKEIMPRDSMNEVNWAYWHLGNNHVDSAIFYFNKLLESRPIHSKAEFLRILIKLEKDKGNKDRVNDYYAQLLDAEDSLKEISQVEETRRTEAQYRYTLLVAERDEQAGAKKKLSWLLTALFAACVIIGFFILHAVRHFRKRKEMELVRERLLRQEEENKNRRGTEQLEQNRRQIEQLQLSLDDALQKNDSLMAKQLSDEKELLTLKNMQIETQQQQEKLKMEQLSNECYYQKLFLADGMKQDRLTEEEWVKLAHSIDDIYDHFTSRLTSVAKLSPRDLKICYLVKLNVPLVNMASLLCVSKSAVTLARLRMWKKITGENGTASQLDEFIKSF